MFYKLITSWRFFFEISKPTKNYNPPKYLEQRTWKKVSKTTVKVGEDSDFGIFCLFVAIEYYISYYNNYNNDNIVLYEYNINIY